MRSVKNHHKQAGFTLLEILVSIFVLSIGLLGLAALQAATLRQNAQNYNRSVAITQANEMLERMEANTGGVAAGSYNSITATPSNPSCSVCTTSERAQKDAYLWNTANATLLPSGRGTVTGNSSYFTITIRWDENRTGATGTNCSTNTSVDLTCYRINAMF